MPKLLYSAIFKTGSTAVGKEGPVLLTSAKEVSSFSYFCPRPASGLSLFA